MAAHESMARLEERQAGPYRLIISVSSDPVRVTEPLEVVVSGPALKGATITLIGQPGFGTSATPTRPLGLTEEVDEPGSYAGTLVLGSVGAWDLDIRVVGAGGSARALVPVTVASPTALPRWLGWAVGLSPLLGLALFARWNWLRYPEGSTEATRS